MGVDKEELRAVLINDTSLNNHYGCAIVTEQIYTMSAANGIIIKATVPLRANWKEDKYASAIYSADLVIVNGEGSVHHARSFAKDMLRVVEYCKEHGIPAFFINGVYQENDFETDVLMQQFTKIWVREGFSQKTLAASGIEATVVPDMVISFEPQVSRLADHALDVLYSDSVTRDVTQELARRAWENHGGRTEFLTLRKSAKRPSRNGVFYLIDTIRKMRSRRVAGALIYNPGVSGHCKSIDDFLTVICSSRLVVTGRFHMLCICLILEIPFLAIKSNSHKIESMLEDIGLSERLIKCTMPDVARLQSASEWQDDELLKLRNWLVSSRVAINQMFSEISQTVRNI